MNDMLFIHQKELSMFFLIKSLIRTGVSTALLCCHAKCPNEMLHGKKKHVLSKSSARKKNISNYRIRTQ